MARAKQEEVKEEKKTTTAEVEEKVTENVTENQENVTESNEEVTKVEENEKEEETIVENPVEDAKTEENASNEEQEADVHPTKKVPTVKEIFRDKYNTDVVYQVGDTFILDESIEDNLPVPAEKGKYKVSKARYDELQRSLYVE